jgi:acyl-CoA reductase-like NAD-dependent aldehyde dehydrogenase
MYVQLSPVFGAIAAGNCVLIKPSEMSSATEKLLFDALPKYVDEECIKVLVGGIGATTEILKYRWDKIFFTGSTRVGKIVMRAAAEHLTPVSLELGGKSPTIVDADVGDLQLAATRIMWGKCLNAGQTCIAPDYVFCHEKVSSFMCWCCAILGAEIQVFFDVLNVFLDPLPDQLQLTIVFTHLCILLICLSSTMKPS